MTQGVGLYMQKNMNIDYREIHDYYVDVINRIYNELSSYTDTGEKKENAETIREEYMNAYGYLQRAGWRLDELDTMMEFKDEENFFWFAMNNLSSARHRIEHYLNNTNWVFKGDFDYKKYDNIVMDYYQPFRTGDAFSYDNSRWWEHYWILESKVQTVKYLKEDIRELEGNVGLLEDYVSKPYEDMSGELLERISELLSDLNVAISLYLK